MRTAAFKTCLLPCCLPALFLVGPAGCLGPAEPPVKVLMIVGGIYHDYETLPPRLADRLEDRGDVRIAVTSDLSVLTDFNLADYDVLLFNTCQQTELPPAAREAIMRHVRGGKGLVAMHCSLWSFQWWPEWAEMIGGFAPGHDKYGPFPVTVVDTGHPTMLGLGGGFTLTDEPYTVDRHQPAVELLIRTANVHNDRDGNLRDGPEPQVWVRDWGDGRVFTLTFGHDEQSQMDERFITLLHNGILWSARRLPDVRHNLLTASEEAAGFELMFDGRRLDGWSGDSRYWSVEDGQIVGRGVDLPHNSFLTYTPRAYGDFLLRFSVKLVGGNSGVQFRSAQHPDHVVKGYQADVGDDWYGSLYEEGGERGVLVNGWEGKGETFVIPGGWNEMTVRAVGPKITITLNGLTTAQFDETNPSKPTSGVIALQLHAGPPMEVRFRDIRTQPLPAP